MVYIPEIQHSTFGFAFFQVRQTKMDSWGNWGNCQGFGEGAEAKYTSS
jgi:hypothetical protein